MLPSRQLLAEAQIDYLDLLLQELSEAEERGDIQLISDLTNHLLEE